MRRNPSRNIFLIILLSDTMQYSRPVTTFLRIWFRTKIAKRNSCCNPICCNHRNRNIRLQLSPFAALIIVSWKTLTQESFHFETDYNDLFVDSRICDTAQCCSGAFRRDTNSAYTYNTSFAVTNSLLFRYKNSKLAHHTYI